MYLQHNKEKKEKNKNMSQEGLEPTKSGSTDHGYNHWTNCTCSQLTILFLKLIN